MDKPEVSSESYLDHTASYSAAAYDKPVVDVADADAYQYKAEAAVHNLGDTHEAEVLATAPKRTLGARQVAVFSMAGSIGTNIFINTSVGLVKSGPISLILGYLYMASILFCINICLAEMVSFLPIRGSLHRFVGAFVDPALGAASSFNYWVLCVSMMCLEINALTSVLLYWVDESHTDMLNIIVPCLVIFAYFVLNIWDARWFGETEFWVGLLKVITAAGLLIMTVFLMCGANPHHDSFGFRYWVHPGPMNSYLVPGAEGRFLSFVAAIINAAWTFQGPDMISIIAGDTKNPRKVIPRAFKTVTIRLTVFFIGSATAVGILVPYNDPILKAAIESSAPGASRTAYVRALNRLDIPVLPHIINAVIFTSIFSAGNALAFAGSRSLQAMALEGKMWKVFARSNRNGTPYVAVLATVAIGLLAFMQVSKGSSQALFYFLDISTCSLLVTWVIIALSHLFWRRAIKAQGFDMSRLPFVSRYAPYSTYYALANGTLVLLICGWNIFLKGQWDTYFALGMTLVAYVFYKVLFKTKMVKASELDICHGIEEVDEHERWLEGHEEVKVKAEGKKPKWYRRALQALVKPFFDTD